ncbi:BON domain-containing protein [Hydrogenophaga sp. RWCD_12]|uniref:BON domain-containing protein n=1 Tax=Hydrogenophaga sp. RWCD_12 TaxID=3391190 RepID=UPI0039847EB3
MNKRTALLFLTAAMAATIVVGGCSKPAETPAAVPEAPAAAAAANVPDADVTNHVTTALQQSESLKGFNIEVVTAKGDVRLIGVLDSQAQIDEALKIARASEGAHAVHDELTVKK